MKRSAGALREVFAAALLVAATETLLLQWTSRVVPPSLLAMDFAATFVILALPLAPVVAFLAAVSPPASFTPLLATTVLALGFYDLSRIRTERISWGEPVIVVLAGISAIGLRALHRTRKRDERGGALVTAGLLVAANAAAWTALHLRGRFTPTPVVLALLGSAVAAQVTCARRLLLPGRFGTARPALAMLSAVAVCVVLSAVSYVVLPGSPRLEVRRPDVPRAAPGRGAPNVIVIVLDTVRADHLSVYGYERPTSPRLAEFAARAHVFRRAIANSNWSLPSHATLLTGLLPHQHGAHTVISRPDGRRNAGDEIPVTIAQRPLPEGLPTIAHRMRQVGYETALIAANYAWLSDAGSPRLDG